MEEEIKEKQEIMPIETPIVVEDFPKNEEQQLDSSDINGMDKYEVWEENNSYKEFDSQLAYSKFVYGINYMIFHPSMSKFKCHKLKSLYTHQVLCLLRFFLRRTGGWVTSEGACCRKNYRLFPTKEI